MAYVASINYVLGYCTVTNGSQLKAHGTADSETEADQWLTEHGYRRVGQWESGIELPPTSANADVMPT